MGYDVSQLKKEIENNFTRSAKERIKGKKTQKPLQQVFFFATAQAQCKKREPNIIAGSIEE